jgi:hypothetical protein
VKHTLPTRANPSHASSTVPNPIWMRAGICLLSLLLSRVDAPQLRVRGFVVW